MDSFFDLFRFTVLIFLGIALMAACMVFMKTEVAIMDERAAMVQTQADEIKESILKEKDIEQETPSKTTNVTNNIYVYGDNNDVNVNVNIDTED